MCPPPPPSSPIKGEEAIGLTHCDTPAGSSASFSDFGCGESMGETLLAEAKEIDNRGWGEYHEAYPVSRLRSA